MKNSASQSLVGRCTGHNKGSVGVLYAPTRSGKTEYIPFMDILKSGKLRRGVQHNEFQKKD